MAGHTDNEIVIAASLEEVWQTANDLTLWPELYKHEYSAVEVLEREPSRVVFKLTTLPREGTTHSWTSERHVDYEQATATARRLDLGPFRYMHLFHAATWDGTQTTLRWVQDFELRPESGISEPAMQAHINHSSQRNLLRHKEFIEHRRES